MSCNCCVPTACKWLLMVNKLPSVLDADFNHAYMLPDDSVYVLSANRQNMVQIGAGRASGVNRAEFEELKKQVENLAKAVR